MRYVLAVYPSELPLGVLLLVAGFFASTNGLEQYDWSLLNAGILWIALGYVYPLITTNIQYVRHRAADLSCRALLVSPAFFTALALVFPCALAACVVSAASALGLGVWFGFKRQPAPVLRLVPSPFPPVRRSLRPSNAA
jgi:hypothetical protein